MWPCWFRTHSRPTFLARMDRLWSEVGCTSGAAGKRLSRQALQKLWPAQAQARELMGAQDRRNEHMRLPNVPTTTAIQCKRYIPRCKLLRFVALRAFAWVWGLALVAWVGIINMSVTACLTTGRADGLSQRVLAQQALELLQRPLLLTQTDTRPAQDTPREVPSSTILTLAIT
jgi:hypothetical protein